MKILPFSDFQKMELKVGKVLKAEKAVESQHLIRMKVDLGEKEPRNILAGIGEWYQPEDLAGKNFIFVANLEPKKMLGEESQGMILCADILGKAVLIPAPDVPPGTIVR